MNILLKGGTVFDGTGVKRRHADVRIAGEFIVDIGDLSPRANEVVLDATDLFVAPGFIDIHTRSDEYNTLLSNPEQTSLLRQGVTSILVGNSGFSLAPLLAPVGNESPRAQSVPHASWVTMGECLDALSTKRFGVNVATLIGHTTVSGGITHGKHTTLRNDELEELYAFLEQSIQEGAFGISVGLLSPETRTTSPDVLRTMMMIAKKHNALYATTIRNERDLFLDSFKELFVLARETGANVQFSHLKPEYPENWKDHTLVLRALSDEGVDTITFDVYPYTTTFSLLVVALPAWITQKCGVLNRAFFSNTKQRDECIRDINSKEKMFRTMVVGSGNVPYEYYGKQIGEFAQRQEKSVGEIVVMLLEMSDCGVMVYSPSLSEDGLCNALQNQKSFITTNGGGYTIQKKNEPYAAHRRSFGAMPKFFAEYVRDKKLLSWEEAIYKVTYGPAQKIGIQNRGTIAHNHYADIVVFDPHTIQDRTNQQDPYQYPDGIVAVIVNGAVAFEQGNDTIVSAGTVLRKT